jgi:hypothetical protein
MAIVVDIQRQKLIDEGEYYAVLRDVQELQGKYGPVLKFWFDITEPGYETSVSGICSKIASPRSKLFRWLIALGADLSQADSFDISTLKGASCIIVVSGVTAPSGEEYVNVVDVKPAKMRRAAGAGAGANLPNSGPGVNHEPLVSGGLTPGISQPNKVQQSVSPQSNSNLNPVPNIPSNPVHNPNLGQKPNPHFQKGKNPLIEEISGLDELEF